MNDIVTRPENMPAAEADAISAGQRLALLREALTNPDVQPEKAIAMADLMFRLEDRDAKRRFIEAKVAAIAAMPQIGKDGQNDHTKTRYAKWETMQPIITPILARYGLALNFDIGHEAGRVSVAPILSGHGWEEKGGAIVLPPDEGKGRSPVQAVASSVSYGKRHASMAMLNLVQRGLSEDDDGNGGGGALRQYNPEQQAFIKLANDKAAESPEAYLEWFKSLDAAGKGWLVMEGKHKEIKEALGIA
jgi:hypothetical protein